MTSTTTTIRLDANLKKEVDKRLKATGLSLNGYFTLAAKQLVIQNRVPFNIVLPAEDQLNQETEKAMVKAQAEELGLIKDDGRAFDNIDDLMTYLDQK